MSGSSGGRDTKTCLPRSSNRSPRPGNQTQRKPKGEMFGLALMPGFLKVSDVEILTNQLGTTEKLNLNLGSSIHTNLSWPSSTPFFCNLLSLFFFLTPTFVRVGSMKEEGDPDQASTSTPWEYLGHFLTFKENPREAKVISTAKVRHYTVQGG